MNRANAPDFHVIRTGATGATLPSNAPAIPGPASIPHAIGNLHRPAGRLYRPPQTRTCVPEHRNSTSDEAIIRTARRSLISSIVSAAHMSLEEHPKRINPIIGLCQLVDSPHGPALRDALAAGLEATDVVQAVVDKIIMGELPPLPIQDATLHSYLSTAVQAVLDTGGGRERSLARVLDTVAESIAKVPAMAWPSGAPLPAPHCSAHHVNITDGMTQLCALWRTRQGEVIRARLLDGNSPDTIARVVFRSVPSDNVRASTLRRSALQTCLTRALRFTRLHRAAADLPALFPAGPLWAGEAHPSIRPSSAQILVDLLDALTATGMREAAAAPTPPPWSIPLLPQAGHIAAPAVPRHGDMPAYPTGHPVFAAGAMPGGFPGMVRAPVVFVVPPGPVAPALPINATIPAPTRWPADADAHPHAHDNVVSPAFEERSALNPAPPAPAPAAPPQALPDFASAFKPQGKLFQALRSTPPTSSRSESPTPWSPAPLPPPAPLTPEPHSPAA